MTQMEVEGEDVDRLVQECALYLLNKHSANIAIKRTDITRAILSDVNKKTQNDVLLRTAGVLRSVHGISMIELNETPKSYLLINEIPVSDTSLLNWSTEERKKMILLLPVLSVIYMNGGSIPEGSLLAFLRKLKIITSDSNISPFFGDVDRLLKKEFVAQKYLMYEATTNSEDNETIYLVHWGARAKNEISKEEILKYVGEVYDCQMSDFTEQYSGLKNTM